MSEIINKDIFKKEFPYCYQEFIKAKGMDFINFNTAIDDLLLRFGIGVLVSPVYSETDKLLGHNSKIRVYPVNMIKRPTEDINVIEDYKKFKSYFNAQKETTNYALNILENSLRQS